MSSGLRRRAVRVERLETEGKSGAALERWWLDDGRAVVAKHIDASHDWVMQATGDVRRVAELWDEGFFGRLPPDVLHGILEVTTASSGPIVVMEDFTGSVFAEPADLRSAHAAVLRAVTGVHRALSDPPATSLCALADYYSLLSPRVAGRFSEVHPTPRLALEGWGRFGELVPSDVRSAIDALHEDVAPLSSALTARASTIVHGDLKLANLGYKGEHVIIIDWGTLVMWAPPAVDYAWYLAINGTALGGGLGDLLDEVRGQPELADDEVALRLALLGALCQLGWEKALGATSDDEAARARERQGLGWWTDQARGALELL